jgi:hypothetical protein
MNNEPQDVTVDDARGLHRVMRALHDGHCPQCGAVFPCENARMENAIGELIGEQCPRCAFTITREEAQAIGQVFQPIMRQNLEVFFKWREARNSPTIRPGAAASPPETLNSQPSTLN